MRAQPQRIRMALAIAALVVGAVSMFLPWWKIDIRFQQRQQYASIGPFDDSSGEVLVTGILVVASALAAFSMFLAERATLVDKSTPSAFRIAAITSTILLGVAATTYTMLAWPESNEGGLAFWSTETTPTPVGNVRVQAYAGAGWYLAILGFVVLPAPLFWVPTRSDVLPPPPDAVAFPGTFSPDSGSPRS